MNLTDPLAHGVEHSKIEGLVTAMKKVDEAVNNSTVLQDDDELFLPVVAGEIRELEALLYIVDDAAISAGVKAGWSFPSGTTMVWGDVGIWNNAALGLLTEQTAPRIKTTIAQSGKVGAILRGLVFVGNSGGFIHFRWAQDVAQVANTIIKRGSYLRSTRLS